MTHSIDHEDLKAIAYLSEKSKKLFFQLLEANHTSFDRSITNVEVMKTFSTPESTLHEAKKELSRRKLLFHRFIGDTKRKAFWVKGFNSDKYRKGNHYFFNH